MSPVSRRTFLAAAGGTALVLGVVPGFRRLRVLTGEAAEIEREAGRLNAFVSIDASGKVTLVTHRAEMGQGAYSVVPQMLAEELEVDYATVEIVVAEGDSARYGSQITGGSSTVRGSLTQLLVAGATARDLLVRAAAQRWGVPPAECRAERGTVVHPASTRRAGYGELVADAARLEPAPKVPLKPRARYTVIGKSLPRRDLPAKVNGSAVFGLDFRLPGMQFAVVERSPRFVGRVKRFDATASLKVPGVTKVVKVERDVFGHRREGVAVVATNTWAAIQGRRALEVEWDDGDAPAVDTETLYARMREAVRSPGNHFRSQGAASVALERATDVLDVTYETPYQAHACMEPLNCVAHVTADSAEIWGPIQGPDWVRGHLADALGLPLEKVRVHMTFLGGGFGRKAFTDWTHEAAMVSKAVGGPVQVVWTREDDLTQGPFRPGMVYRCRGAVANGRVLAFEGTMAGQNMNAQEPGSDPRAFNRDVVEGIHEGWFDAIGHWRFGDAPLEAPIPVMWWRSVYSSTNAFAYESFVDELAAKAGVDPFTFRRRHLRDARVTALLDRLAQVSGWDGRAKGQGYGLALTHCFGSSAGHVVKVRRAGSGVAIVRVWSVIDCGLAVNPDGVKAQVEGSVVMALAAACTHEMTFAGGVAAKRNFDAYRLPLLRDVPPIEVHVIESEHPPGGAGEPGLPGVAPALCNAIADLAGTRIRRLPFDLARI